ncbi:MAG: hypothetical protein AAFO77_10105, partial [Pseudomonadota bacterium]
LADIGIGALAHHEALLCGFHSRTIKWRKAKMTFTSKSKNKLYENSPAHSTRTVGGDWRSPPPWKRAANAFPSKSPFSRRIAIAFPTVYARQKCGISGMVV